MSSPFNLNSYSHLLQELTVSSYVPNDTLLMGGKEQLESKTHVSPAIQAPSMLLLTGPNYSGKSVYMKQVSTFLRVDVSQPSKNNPGCSHCLPRPDWEVC